jgi:mono/diheme cytochrome c family protein
MTGLRRIGGLLLVAGALSVPSTLTAQQAPAAQTPGIPQTDAQKRGEALFLTRCPLCHVHSNQKRQLGIQANTELIGLFKDGAVAEEDVRKLILTGLPRMMPSFQYALDAKQIDDVIAYLKIR